MDLDKSLVNSSVQLPFSVADARRALPTSGLPLKQQLALGSALTGIARICGVIEPAQEEALMLECASLNRKIYAKPASNFGFTTHRHARIISLTRKLMRHFGLLAPESRGYAELTPEWQAVHDRLSRYRAFALIGFMVFCSRHGIAPGEVGSETLARYEAWCLTSTLCRDPVGLARNTASNWNWAGKHVPDWPQTILTRPGMRDQFTRSLDWYHPDFQVDVARLVAHMSISDHQDLYAALGTQPTDHRRKVRPHRKARPRTIQTRIWQILVALAALESKGYDTANFRSLRDLVESLDAVRGVILFLRERTGQTKSTYIAGVIEALRQVAKYHVGSPDDVVDEISRLVGISRPDLQGRMNPKNEARLRALIAQPTRAFLITLPDKLVKDAQEIEKRSQEPNRRGRQPPHLRMQGVARLVAYATALEILLAFAMRGNNLAKLDLDTNLQWIERRRGPSHIFLYAEGTKNEVTMQMKLPERTSAMIDLYLTRYRPLLADPANRFLFVGPGLKQRSRHELTLGLANLITRELGTPVNVHLLRAFVGWVYLNRHPGAYEVVRQLLGHKKVETTIRFYAGLELDAAAEALDAVMIGEREEAAPYVAAAARFGPRRRTRRAPASRLTHPSQEAPSDAH